MSAEHRWTPDPERLRSRAFLDALEAGVMLAGESGLLAVKLAAERILGHDLASLRAQGHRVGDRGRARLSARTG